MRVWSRVWLKQRDLGLTTVTWVRLGKLSIAKGNCCIPSCKGLKPRFYAVKNASWAVCTCMRACVSVCVCMEKEVSTKGIKAKQKTEMSWPQEMLWFGVGLCTSVASVPFISDLKIKDKSSKVWQSSKEIPTWSSLSFSCVCVRVFPLSKWILFEISSEGF